MAEVIRAKAIAADAFADLVHQRRDTMLGAWIRQAETCEYAPLRSFASALTGKVRRVGDWSGWMGGDVRSDRWRCGG
jgi:hypothetical protein